MSESVRPYTAEEIILDADLDFDRLKATLEDMKEEDRKKLQQSAGKPNLGK